MVLFSEKQALHSNPIVWPVIISLFVPSILAFNESTFNAGFEGMKPFLAILFVDCLILLLVFSSKLNVEINKEEIHYRWFPFHFKTQHILWKNVLSAEVRKYNALREYGGWGIKGWSSKNRAYNVDGNIGLQLVLTNGNRILIGTKQSDKLEALLYDLKIPKPEHG
jgi:hypothetical protein